MIWFGESWGAPMCDPEFHVPTPVGVICSWCVEPIEADDQGVSMPMIRARGEPKLISYHLNCQLRQVFGSVGHQLKCCTCYLAYEDVAAFDDPPGLTRREAAQEAVDMWERAHSNG